MKITNAFLAGLLLAVSSSAIAFIDDVSYYTGFGVSHDRVKNANDSTLLHFSSFAGGHFFVGADLHENYGIELGYDFTGAEKKTVTVGAVSAKSKSKLAGFYLDAKGYYPVMDNLKLVATLGFGIKRFEIKYSGDAAILAAADVSARTYKSKRKTILRAGLGLDYMFSDNWGANLMARFENTKKLRFKNNSNAFIGNTKSIGASVYYKF